MQVLTNRKRIRGQGVWGIQRRMETPNNRSDKRFGRSDRACGKNNHLRWEISPAGRAVSGLGPEQSGPKADEKSAEDIVAPPDIGGMKVRIRDSKETNGTTR